MSEWAAAHLLSVRNPPVLLLFCLYSCPEASLLTSLDAGFKKARANASQRRLFSLSPALQHFALSIPRDRESLPQFRWVAIAPIMIPTVHPSLITDP